MGMQVTIKLTGVKKVERRLKKWGNKVPRIAGESLVEALKETMVPTMRTKLKESDSIFTKKTINSLEPN